MTVFGYRPDVGQKMPYSGLKEYIERGYTKAVVLDLSKYFDYAEPHNPAEPVEKTGQR